MQISYFGLTAFKFGSKDRTSVIDPFDKSTGLAPPRGNADIVLLSDKNNPVYSYAQSISGQPFFIDGPGEYDVRDHTVTGIPVKNNGKFVTIYLIEIEGVKILHLGHIAKLELTEDEIEDIGDVDILILPVGNKTVLDFEDAAKIVSMIEPKIVIPSHYKIPGLTIEAEAPEKFLKQMGGKHETMEKLSLKKKDLQENQGIKVIVLEPLR